MYSFFEKGLRLYLILLLHENSRDSLVCVVTRLKAKRTRNRVLLAAVEGDFHLLKALAPALSPTKLPIQLGSGNLSRSKAAGTSSGHLLLTSRSIINGAETQLRYMP